MQSISINDLEEYLTYRLINSYSPELPEKYVAESFKYSQLFSAAKEENRVGRRLFSHRKMLWVNCLGYALSWLYEMRPQKMKNRLMTDVHPPAKYRVNGPFSDIAEFYSAFHITPKDSMYVAESLRVKIW